MEPQLTNTIDSTSFSKIVTDSKKSLETEPTKRKRRTREELMADPNFQTKGRKPLESQTAPLTSSQTVSLTPVDRTKELQPAFKLYSELLLAKPLECPDLALTDQESQALAQVTSNLMNAFPEYFNNSDPRVAAILGAAFVAAPIGYSKYKIYKSIKPKAVVPEKENVPA